MSDYCVVVTGGAKARFYTLEPVDFPELESGPNLVHCGDLFNPQKESSGKDLYADPKTGRGRAARGGPAHGYDDHRSQHKDELDRRFSRKILTEISSLVKANNARCVVLVAPAPMLGILRQELHALSKRGIEVMKVAKDMTKFSARRIHASLAKENILPKCRKPGA
ncbi:MAG: host attachment protein [Deltaproteobacteria bacterium]|nr:host attachment protein [Deltaproteobacteria bacterium]